VGFLIAFALFVGFTIVGQLLRPRPRFDVPQPSGLGDFDFPTATEDRVVPVAWGTVYQRAANVLWYGDLEARAFDRDGQHAGYRYHLGVVWAICQGPVDGVRVDFDERNVVAGYPGPQNPRLFSIVKPDLYGGDDQEGGVSGTMAFYYGTDPQVAEPYLQTQLGANVPGWKGLCYAVARKMYLGNSPYVKPPQFAVQRFPNQLGVPGGRHVVNAADANPMCALYELLTNQLWGCSVSPGAIDLPAFLAAADTCHAEGFGISMLVDKELEARDLAAEVLRHVDGLLFVSPVTGLLTVKLARFDYSVPSIPLLDASNVREVEFSRLAWEETANLVYVRYVDRDAQWKERLSPPAMDLANVQVRGGQVVPETIDYRGCATASMAERLASKALATRSYPLAAVRFKTNRAAWDLLPGDPFRFSYAPYGIGLVVMRITNVAGGTLQEGDVTVDAVEDVFAVAWSAYGPSGLPDWDPPEGTLPVPLLAQRLLDAPFGLVVPPSPPFGYSAEDWLFVLLLAVRDVGVHTGFEIWSHGYEALPATPEQYELTNQSTTFVPSGTLESLTYPAGHASLRIVAGPDMDRLRSLSSSEFATGRGVFLVEDEMIGWQTIVNNGDGTYTVAAPAGPSGSIVRGVLDTVPGPHAAGARVFFLDGWTLTEDFGYPPGGHTGSSDWKAVRAKALTKNLAGVLPIASATGMLLLLTTSGATIDIRPRRPWLPSFVRWNGVLWPKAIVGELALTWKRRNRLHAYSYSANLTIPNVLGDDPEPDVEYQLDAYGELGTLVRTFLVTGTGVTYPLAQETTDSGLGRPNRFVRTILRARKLTNGYLSLFAVDTLTFDCEGWGMLYGWSWGGGNAELGP